VALAECCVTGPRRLGAAVILPEATRVDELLFGEAPSRIVVTVAPGDVDRLMVLAEKRAVPAHVLGRVGGPSLDVRVGAAARLSVPSDALADAFENGLARALEQPIEALSGRDAAPAEGGPNNGGPGGEGDQ
jgi:phosphoribosylformylglycinamidine synthase